ncbi:hypothetical protein ACEN2J_07240 [Pseudorhodobacter sp. W20_MBD10_FR17]|uniref:hypothetical protein n=1 Tax=Pseudorhodobacter sp. W20_MBD10_FR17 TaxID=3240266 RepID=UPI003F990934
MDDDNRRFERVKSSAQSVFGAKFRDISCPGGIYRESYRIHLDDSTVVATSREDKPRTALEAFVLFRLQKTCDDIPRYLGFSDNVLFQSDVGQNRLTLDLTHAKPARRNDLMAAAVAGLFRIQRAGRENGIEKHLPHLGVNRSWIEHLVNLTRKLDKQVPLGKGFDRFALYDALSVPATQFVKWDCRAGNAASDAAGTLRWFDFEYAGVRHGAEDFAWFIADETVPVAPEVSFQIVADAYDPSIGHAKEDWLRYLSLYTVFQALERLRLIQYEVKERGWKTKEKVLGRDDVGMHPEFAAQICRVGAWFADRDPLTRPIVRSFEGLGQVFSNLQLDAANTRTKAEAL